VGRKDLPRRACSAAWAGSVGIHCSSEPLSGARRRLGLSLRCVDEEREEGGEEEEEEEGGGGEDDEDGEDEGEEEKEEKEKEEEESL